MTVGTTAASGASAGDENHGLSEYEKLRLQKIKRNEDRMKELGLFRTKDALSSLRKTKAATNGKKEKSSRVSPEPPQRRSSRKRKSVANYREERVIPMHSDEEGDEETDNNDDNNDADDDNKEDENEDDYQMSEDENLGDGENDEEEESYLLARPKKKPKQTKTNKAYPGARSNNPQTGKVSTTAAAIDTTTFDSVNPRGGLTLEYAKTGRSKCRKCGTKIEKDKPRVGMEAWIVGRNCITWQCPECLLQNLCCVYERSNGGKGRCKVTHTPFAKGQLKVGIRCHTATSYYHVRAVVGVLNNVVALMATDGGVNNGLELAVDAISGNEKLSPEDREKLGSLLKTVSANGDPTNSANSIENKGMVETDSMEDEISVAKAAGKTNKKGKGGRDQPGVGAKTGAAGKVEWKFGGRTCYGTLLPGKESKTHCYARTHKGNVKTLAKGKDYWSMIVA